MTSPPDHDRSVDAADGPTSVLPGEKTPLREVLAWAFYDFANSSYTTVVITAIYSAFFVAHVVPADSAWRDTWWSVAMVVSTALSLLLSPLIGAICDYSAKKKFFLTFTTLLCVVGTAALGFTGPGMLVAGLVWVIISNLAFMLSETLIGAFLPEIARGRSMGVISGLGWGIGYFGGLGSLILASFVIIRADPSEDLGAYILQNQWAMWMTAAFFLVSAIPTLVIVRERAQPRPGFASASMGRLIRVGFDEMRQAAATARNNRVLFQFFVAFMVYMAGLDAVIKFVGIYAREEVQLTNNQFGLLFVILQLSAAVGAIGFGFLESRIGPKATVLGTLALWCACTMGIWGLSDLSRWILGSEEKEAAAQIFLVLAVAAGLGLGSIQSSSRAVVGLLAEPATSSQMFGFWSVFMRLGSILGASFGVAADAIGSRRHAVLLIVAFFVIGAMLLSRIDIEGQARRVRALAAGDTPPPV
jgi:UMF1 family MFS transporter